MDKKLSNYNERMDALIRILGKKSHKDVWSLMTDWQKSQLEHLLSVNGAQVDEAVREARLHELSTISGGKYLRNVHTLVKNANGDVYEDDSRLYISKYEVQERIKQLTTQPKPTKENE